MGIVIKQSLNDENGLKPFQIRANRRIGSWDVLYVSVESKELDESINCLQASMVDKYEDCWYNHLFKDEELIVIYQDKYFKVSIDHKSWDEVIQYGLNNGIPMEQLDFNPRTMKETDEFFNLKRND
ncbi:hypothetical protein EJP82_11995 [Paenibacillus anaericanus]|uniref:Uncharacterized protein n=2 Tax=Paenibacillus TaxID=44249 RepID=A0A3S1C9E7_9BACL|nr:hypothetical protein EJP82_11995 [Paenibacillus anaericanus]